MPEYDISETFGRQIDGLLRVSRSTDGRRALWYHPDWRFRQAQIYCNTSTELPEDQSFRMPAWEDDEIIANYFVFRQTGQCSTEHWTELISSAANIDEWNDHHGLGSRIKAFAVAQKSDMEIADILDIDEEFVSTYIDLFYDVRPILHKPERMASVVFPFSPDLSRKLSTSQQREFLWIAAAFAGSEELLEFFTTNRFQMSREEMDSCLDMIISMTTAQSMEYGVSLRTEGLPRATHFDKFIAIQDIYVKHNGVKAQQEAMNTERKGLETLDKWQSILQNVGLRRSASEGRVIDVEDELVTNLSISELRRGEAGGSAERKDRVRQQIIDESTGVGVQVYTEE